MSIVHIVDDDAAVREGLIALLESAELEVAAHAGAETFLRSYERAAPECLVLDMRMPGLSGLDLQTELGKYGVMLPIIFLSAYGDIPTSVRAIKAGAVDFLTKPVDSDRLLQSVHLALKLSEQSWLEENIARDQRAQLERLTPRERDVFERALAGRQNKDIARELGISYRTVEIHRARALQKMGASSLLELAHLRQLLSR